jgi:anti-sigma B factor antagonist
MGIVGHDIHVKIQTDASKPGTMTITPFGPIDSDTYLDFEDKIKPALKPGIKGIVLDLANVEYISSAGLGVLFTMKKFLKQQGGELLFSNLKPQIVRLFEIVNALPKETLFKNTEEADAYLYKMMNLEREKKGGV